VPLNRFVARREISPVNTDAFGQFGKSLCDIDAEYFAAHFDQSGRNCGDHMLECSAPV